MTVGLGLFRSPFAFLVSKVSSSVRSGLVALIQGMLGISGWCTIALRYIGRYIANPVLVSSKI